MNIKLNSSDIMMILPHRYPMLLIDKVIKWKPKHLTAVKMLTINEQMFQGHFPKRPILPGIYMIEMSAQAAALMYILDFIKPDSEKSLNETLISNSQNIMDKIGYLGAVKNVKFQHLAHPGDSLNIQVRELMSMNGVSEVAFKLTNQDNQTISQGRITVTKNENNS